MAMNIRKQMPCTCVYRTHPHAPPPFVLIVGHVSSLSFAAHRQSTKQRKFGWFFSGVVVVGWSAVITSYGIIFISYSRSSAA